MDDCFDPKVLRGGGQNKQANKQNYDKSCENGQGGTVRNYESKKVEEDERKEREQ